ncbi:MAG: hypothetical protein HY730_10070 [Candidatus Tectomicrobia bacterium]|uniref:Uncharacterized protein n=1 Tax=Tectimicrobiota bacterium TaxID=2528274 RepID=A0A933LR05_UNCTE|nr:hypothetical protein [Candidatus Tectomicrobia bacterium]
MMRDGPRQEFSLDDESEIDPDLTAEPILCVSCLRDDNPAEEILCTLTRIDQRGQKDFKCYAYELKY